MYGKKVYQVEDLTASINKLHVCPIVRGKSSATTEFGTKITISLINGNAFINKLGEGKRRYGLGHNMARLQETTETVIALQFLVMKLECRLRILF